MGTSTRLANLSTGMLLLVILGTIVVVVVALKILFATLSLAIALAPAILLGLGIWWLVRHFSKPKGAA